MNPFKRRQDQADLPQPQAAIGQGDSEPLALPQANPIGPEQVRQAAAELQEYKRGKHHLESRVVEDEQWYQRRHWDILRRNEKRDGTPRPEPTSAWLFNTIMNKHADAEDNFPEPNILPREQSDQQDAKMLSSIVPVVLERSDFAQTYSDNWWEKLKHGTAPYFIGWNNRLENGLGDIDIRRLDLLNLFWQPGITDIQQSRRLYIVDLWDKDVLEAQYPQMRGKTATGPMDLKQYIYDDQVDTSGKSMVVDCYYKVQTQDGRTLVHLLKYCGDTLLFASENDPTYQGRGFYDHGMYPVVFDTLFPEKGTPIGFGYVAITKDPQMYIDKLNQSILENAMMSAKPRYFVSRSTNVNREQFLDVGECLVDVEGRLEDSQIKQIEVSPLDTNIINVLQMKIDEMKETAANRDVNSGAAGSGVTAAAAIAALQEAGNKNSRDMISQSYRAYTQIIYLCIELIRQFYDEERTFRITGPDGQYQFASYSNRGLRDQMLPPDYPGQDRQPDYVPRFRRPIFDIKVKAERKNPFSQMAQNETAKELYRLGAFSPERATESLLMLDMMEFEGKDAIVEKVQQGQTLLSVCQQMKAQMDQMAAIISSLTGRDITGQDQGGGMASASGGQTAQAPAQAQSGSGSTMAARSRQSQSQAMTGYGQRLAQRAGPDMSSLGQGVGMS